jgi:Abnormal spindle-like microcephaly-assoc'd, ASPM-SPD-2-Hydin
VLVGGSATQNLTVTASTASVTISQANVTGTGFSLSGLTVPMTLAAGQSATFQVKFAPTSAGSVTGSLSLTSNASNSPMMIAMSGAGATTISHSATLNWIASTSSNVVGYYVYRGTQSGGPYTKLNGTPVAATTYTDSNVVAGATYFYVVTAVDSTGLESAHSKEVSATIPTP